MAEERKTLEELNLLDNFLFTTMVAHPSYGETFSRHLLKLVLNREVGKLKVIPQSVYYGADVNLHGAILDAYLEEGEDGEDDATVYDVEPENNSREKAKRALPRRVRFYRAKIDGRGLKAGEDYGKLRKLVMIVITSFDPFDEGHMRYTIRNACVEVPEMSYDDGTMTVFLNTKGNTGQESEELREFLRYAEKSTLENASSEKLRELHQMVENVKHDEEVQIRYMRLWEEKERIRSEALEEGIKEGQAMERANVEREHANAEKERMRADLLEKENKELRAKLAERK